MSDLERKPRSHVRRRIEDKRLSDLEIGAQAPDAPSISHTALAENTISHDDYNAEDNAELLVLDEPFPTGDACQDEQLPAENEKQSLGNNHDPVNDVHSSCSTKENTVLFSKFLSKTDIETRLSIPSASLRFIPIHEEEHSTTLAVIDSNRQQWNFKVSIRRDSSHPKPVLSGDWSSYVKEKGLKVGDRISIFVEKNEAGNDEYRVRAERRIFNVFAGMQL